MGFQSDINESMPHWPWSRACWNLFASYNVSVSVKKMREGETREASDIVKAKSSEKDPRATGGLVSNVPHPWVNQTRQHNSAHVCMDTELALWLTLLELHWILQAFFVCQEDGGEVNRGSWRHSKSGEVWKQSQGDWRYRF